MQVPTKRNTQEDAKIDTLTQHLETKFDHVLVNYYLFGLQIPMGIEAELNARLQTPYAKPIQFALGEKSYELAQFGLGLKQQNAPLVRRGPEYLREVMRAFPAGVIPLDPARVVTQVKAEHYEILPRHLGIMQLLTEGRIGKIGGMSFLVTEPIPRLPTGLRASKFFLAPDVPLPIVPKDLFSVRSQETGECLSGPNCK